MNLSEPFIRRPVMTMLLTITVIVFGVLSYRQLPVNDLPAVDFPVIQVSTNYPGASPETVASNIATPLERQFMQIPGLELITSSSTQGNCAMTLQFDLNKRVEDAATDVQASINQATGSLPIDLPSPPTFTKFNPNDQAVIYLGLVSDSLTNGQLYDYGSTQIGQRISILPGVSKVDIYGSKAAIRIKADPSALATRGLTVEDLANAIREGTSYQGAGQFDGDTRTMLLQPKGQLDSAEQYNNLVIANRGGAPVYLKDVAKATDSLVDERSFRSLWARGQPLPAASVTLAVSRQPGANAVAVAQAVKDLLPVFKAELPGSIRLIPIFDRSVTIMNSVTDVKETLLIAFVLVVLVIFIFLGRATDTVIPVVAMPMSLLITFMVMHVLGYSIDNLSLLALTLAIGFLVDDAIVFLENAVRRMETGESAFEASLHGAKEISFTILSMTLSLAAVFIPLVFMPGLIGRTFQQFAIVIIVAIIASGLVSLTLTPLMCARMLRSHASNRKGPVEQKVGAVIKRVLDAYGKSLWFFLRHRYISFWVWVICFVGTIILFTIIPKSFLPVGDSGFLRGVVVAQEGTSPKGMRAYQERVDKVLRENPAVQTSLTIAGLTGRLTSSQALALAFLKPVNERAPIDKVREQLAAELGKIPGIFPVMQAVPVLQISTGATANAQGKFAYALTGVEMKKVYASSDQLLAKLRTYPGIDTVRSDLQTKTPNLEIEIEREKAATYGVSAQKILSALRNAYSQNYVYLIKKPTDQYQVIMEVADPKRTQPENLELIWIRSDDGKSLVPLKAVAKWKEVLGPQAVNHINQFPSVTIFFNLKPGTVIGDAADFVEKTAREVLPPDIQGSLQGEALVFKQTVQSLTVLMLFAVFAMYVILGILYESYIHPITVLSALPVATVGGLATLFIFRSEASLYAFVGMFLLIGIVKKNGIMMIDFALQRMREGLPRLEAVHEACVERFRPIMMTTAAALMGAVPLALGFGSDGASRRPLGLIIVGGLLVSQLLTLYVTPVLFLYLEEFQERVRGRIPFFRPRISEGTEVKEPTEAVPGV